MLISHVIFFFFFAFFQLFKNVKMIPGSQAIRKLQAAAGSPLHRRLLALRFESYVAIGSHSSLERLAALAYLGLSVPLCRRKAWVPRPPRP